MSQNDLGLAGYANIADGTLGRPVPSTSILVPGFVSLEGDAIHWELTESTRWQEVSRSTLNGFIRLWSGTPAAITRFARKWGVLCFTAGERPRPCGEGLYEGFDPIQGWRYYSRRASAALSIAAALRMGKLGDGEDWNQIAAAPDDLDAAGEHHKFGMSFSYRHPTTIERARMALRGELHRWFSCWKSHRLNGVSDFSVVWNSNSRRWELQIDYNGFLFAAIALQLALVVAEADSLYTCSACGIPYIRDKKRPRAGWANYCEKCAKQGVAQRRAVENYRGRKAECRRLNESGLSADEIGAKLGADPRRIKGWLKETTKHVQTETR